MLLEKLVGEGNDKSLSYRHMQLKEENEGERTVSVLYFWCYYSLKIVMTTNTIFLFRILKLCTLF